MHHAFALNRHCVCWHDISSPAPNRVSEEEAYNGALSHNKTPSSLFRISDIFSLPLKILLPIKKKKSLKKIFFIKTINEKEGAGRPRGLKIERDESLRKVIKLLCGYIFCQLVSVLK